MELRHERNRRKRLPASQRPAGWRALARNIRRVHKVTDIGVAQARANSDWAHIGHGDSWVAPKTALTSKNNKWSRLGSNQRPSACEAEAKSEPRRLCWSNCTGPIFGVQTTQSKPRSGCVADEIEPLTGLS